MRLFVCLALFACMTACSPAIDVKIPEDHPANPQANLSPSRPAAEYIYHLPSPPPLLEPTGTPNHTPMGNKDPSDRTLGPSHTEEEDMKSKMRGAPHEH
jgi:hypothetical protein